MNNISPNAGGDAKPGEHLRMPGGTIGPLVHHTLDSIEYELPVTSGDTVSDLVCDECGEPFELDGNEVATHITADGDVDYDADGDHVPYGDESNPDPLVTAASEAPEPSVEVGSRKQVFEYARSFLRDLAAEETKSFVRRPATIVLDETSPDSRFFTFHVGEVLDRDGKPIVDLEGMDASEWSLHLAEWTDGLHPYGRRDGNRYMLNIANAGPTPTAEQWEASKRTVADEYRRIFTTSANAVKDAVLPSFPTATRLQLHDVNGDGGSPFLIAGKVYDATGAVLFEYNDDDADHEGLGDHTAGLDRQLDRIEVGADEFGDPVYELDLTVEY